MWRIIVSAWISPLPSSATRLPSRSTTTRSAHRSTSARRCEMKMTETPSAFSRAMILSSRSVSDAVRLEVGSSMMTRRALSDSALAISTSCICASDSVATGVSAEKSAPSCFSSGPAQPVQFALVDQPERPALQRLATDEDVRGGGQVLEQVQFLVHEGDAAAHRAADGQPRHFRAVELDRAGARRDNAAEDLHQRRFAGAVLSDEADHFALADGKADVVHGLDAGIHLRDSRHLQERIGHRPIMQAGSSGLQDAPNRPAGR